MNNPIGRDSLLGEPRKHQWRRQRFRGAAASALPRNPKVAARIAYLSSQISKKAISPTAVTEERTLTEMARIGFANMNDFMTIGPDDLPRLAPNLIREQAAAPAEATVDTISQGPTRKGQGAYRR